MNKIFLLFFLPFMLYASSLEQIKVALIKEYQHNFPRLIIKNVELQNNNLPKDFNELDFVRLARSKFNRASGFLRAEFMTKDKIPKNIFLRYFIKADLEVLRANKQILRGSKLEANDYSIVLMDFDKVPLGALALDDDLKLVSKTLIPKNAILRQNMFKNVQLVKRGAIIKGILKDDSLHIVIELSALESGNKGEIIKLKTKEGRLMQGEIISKNEVILQ